MLEWHIMDNKNISLVGFMGSGKSAVSKKLAEILEREVVSSDDIIVQKQRRSISEIFQESGEAHFRAVEKNCILELSSKENLVIDCGGGVVIDPENIENLKKGGILVFLEASPEVLYDRVKHCTNRPLLQVENPIAKIKELLDQRKEFYAKADFIVNTDGKRLEEVCEEILVLVSD